MQRRRAGRAVLAMFVVVALAFLPLLHGSSGKAAASDDRVAVCTSNGLVWVGLVESAPSEGHAGGHFHCPSCGGGSALPGFSPLRAPLPAPRADLDARPTSGSPPPASAASLPPPACGPPRRA